MASSKKSEQGLFAYTLAILKQRKYAKLSLIFIAAFFVLYSFLYGVWQVPVLELGVMRMSAITAGDIAYLAVISVIAGLMVALLKYKRDDRATSGMAGAGGIFAGAIATVCPVCQSVTFLALGGTAAIIPLAFLIPYLWVFQIAALFLLGFSLYLVANSAYTKTCAGCGAGRGMSLMSTVRGSYGMAPASGTAAMIMPSRAHENAGAAHATKHTKSSTSSSRGTGPFLYKNNIAFFAIVVVVALLVVNSVMITSAFAASGPSRLGDGSISLKPGFEYGSKVTLKPMPLAAGESPRFQGYRTIVKPLPTISELAIAPATGDVVQDLINNVIPRGTPWYGQEAGVSFDDAERSATLWGRARSIELDAAQEQRWNRIVNSFTCDYCCGSPQQPTIITRCGCAHAQAAQGMARWLVKNYGDRYSDEEIYGEMARWYAVWYPGPTIKRIAQELEAAN